MTYSLKACPLIPHLQHLVCPYTNTLPAGRGYMTLTGALTLPLYKWKRGMTGLNLV